MRRVLRDVDCVCAQTESWGSRFIDLGLPANRLTVAGSLKFDAVDVSATGADLHVDDRVLRYFAFTEGHPVLIAASTLDDEDGTSAPRVCETAENGSRRRSHHCAQTPGACRKRDGTRDA